MNRTRRIWSFLAMAMAVMCVPAGAQVLINEFDCDQVGFDTQEFIELFDGGAGSTDLSGLIVVLYSGATDASYMTIDLAGFTTDINGFFTIGSTGMGTPVEIPPGALGWLENGPDAIAVYADLAANFPNGTAVTPVNLVDAVVYSTDNVQAPNLIAALLQAGELQLNENGVGYGEIVSMGRCPDGAGDPFTTTPFTYGLPTHTTANDCSFATPTAIPTDTPTVTPTRTPTATPTATPTWPPAPPCDSEYVQNGGMEAWSVYGPSGPPDGWSRTIPNPTIFTVEQETTTVFAGTSSARCYKTGTGPLDACTLTQVVPFQVLPDTIYVFSTRVFDDDLMGYVHIFVQWRDINNVYISVSDVSANSTDLADWQLLSVTDVSPSNAFYAVVQVRVFDYDNFPVEVFIDEVSLIQPCFPVPTPTPTFTPSPTPAPTQAPCEVNFLANPSFELWSGLSIVDWYGDTGVLIQPDSVHIHEGATAANVSRTMSGTDMTSIYMPVTGSGLYDAGIWIIDNDPNLDARFYVLFYNSSFNWVGSSPWYDTSGESPDFQELSFTRMLAQPSAVWARVRVRFIDTDGSYPPATGITGSIVVDDGWIFKNCDSSTPTPLPTPTVAPSRTIHEIQYTTDPLGDSPYLGQIVRTTGIITAVEPGHPDIFIQDSAGEWNGLHITVPTGAAGLLPGDLIAVQGVVAEVAGMTTIMDPDLIQVLNHGYPLPAPLVRSSGAAGQESCEGVLVQVNDAAVSSVTAGPGEWEVTDSDGPLRVGSIFSYTYAPTLDEMLDWVRGPMVSSSGLFKIQPRDDGDIRIHVTPVPATGGWGLLIMLAVPGLLLLKRFRR